MIIKDRKKIQKYVLIFVVAVILAIFYLTFKSPQIWDKEEIVLPPNFIKAYSAASDLSLAISDFTSEAVNQLNKINEADRSGDYIRAFNLTVEQAKKHEGLRIKSVELLTELQKMAASAEQITSSNAQQLALQAVSTQVSLVSHLLIYNERWISLLNHLREKFLSANPFIFNPKTEELIRQINDGITSINGLNRKYHSLMEELRRALNSSFPQPAFSNRLN